MPTKEVTKPKVTLSETDKATLEYKKAVYEWGWEAITDMREGFPCEPFPYPPLNPTSEPKRKKIEEQLKKNEADLKEVKLDDPPTEEQIEKLNKLLAAQKEYNAAKKAAEQDFVTEPLFYLLQTAQDTYIITTPLSVLLLIQIKREIDELLEQAGEPAWEPGPWEPPTTPPSLPAPPVASQPLPEHAAKK